MVSIFWGFCAKMNFFDVRQEKNLVYGTKYFSDPPHIHSAILEFFAHFAFCPLFGSFWGLYFGRVCVCLFPERGGSLSVIQLNPALSACAFYGPFYF